MKITKTDFNQLFIIQTDQIKDERGIFIKQFSELDFEAFDLNFDFKEAYYSVSKKGVFRGMHFQIPPFEHEKVVYVSKGKIYDIVLDLRKCSRTYGKYFEIILDEESANCLYIPKGFAHGFLSLENGSKVHYLQTSRYNKECDNGVKYDSFSLDIEKLKNKFDIKDLIVSQRDKSFETFEEFTRKDIFC